MQDKAMIDGIVYAAESDTHLTRLLEKAQEYGQVYLVAKERQKGCDGFGEVTNLREEFKEVVDGMIEYCKKRETCF